MCRVAVGRVDGVLLASPQTGHSYYRRRNRGELPSERASEPIALRPRRPSSSGQSLVEFVLVFPLFFVLLLAIIEFAFALNALVSVDFATRDAALAAAEAGQRRRCRLLDPPSARRQHDGAGRTTRASPRSASSRPTRTARPSGPVNVYDRNGATSCPLADGTPGDRGVPAGVRHLPDTSRCNELAGCKVQPTVDTIGVQISYGYGWVTPLHWLMPDARARLHDGQGQRDAHGADPVIRRRSPGPPRVARPWSSSRIVLPVFLLILLGILEFGFAFSHHITMEYATREGARMGAGLANGSVTFDCKDVDDQVVAAVQRVLTASGSQIDISQVGEIRIYKADANGAGNRVGQRLEARQGPQGGRRQPAVQAAVRQLGRVHPQQRRSGTTDSIGVSLAYDYRYITPLGSLIGLVGTPRPVHDRPDGHGPEPGLIDAATNRRRPEPSQRSADRAARSSSSSPGAMLLLMMMAAVVVDVSWYWVNSLRVQRAADAAALAGAVMLPEPGPRRVPARRRGSHQERLHGGRRTSPSRRTGTRASHAGSTSRSRAPADTFFMRVIGITSIPITRTAKAEFTLPVPMGSPQNYYGVGFYESAAGALTVDDPLTGTPLGVPGLLGRDLHVGRHPRERRSLRAGVHRERRARHGQGRSQPRLRRRRVRLHRRGRRGGEVRLFDPIFCATGDNGHGGSYGAGDHWTDHAPSQVVAPVAVTYRLYNTRGTLANILDDGAPVAPTSRTTPGRRRSAT